MAWAWRIALHQREAGNEWWLATLVEDVSDEEIARRAQAAHKQAVAAK